MRYASVRERLVFWFYTTKVLSGTALGLVFGYFMPDILLAIILMLAILAGIVIIFRYLLNLSEPMPKMVLWYGTFSYFMTVIAFWALIYNLY